MRYYRIETGHGPAWAREDGDRLRVLVGDPWTGATDSSRTIAANETRLLAPVQPSKVVAVGLNYKDHAAERNKPLPKEPLLFLKPSTAVIGPDEPIRRPAWAGRIDHEAEMGIVIGKAAHDVASPEAGLEHVLGAVCVNDVTARELQDKDVQFTRAKGFDTFCPVGPCLATGLDWGGLAILGSVNGQVRQRSNTRELIFPVGYLVWFVSRVMTLLPGDMITTGTPSGIGPLETGDVVEVELEGVGRLRNPVL